MKKLNLGCGVDKKEGWINADIRDANPIVDFNIIPYPFKDDELDEVLIKQVLEYLAEPEKVLTEIHRICKNNAIIEVFTPHYNNIGAYNDMNYQHYFCQKTFIGLVKRTYWIDKTQKFKIVLLELMPTRPGKYLFKFIREPLSYFIGGLITRVHVKLKVLK